MMLTKLRGIKPAAFAALAAVLAGCGFHLEGAGPLPKAMAKTYIEAMDHNSEFFTSLRDALRMRGSQIVSTPEQADAVLSIIQDDTGQRVLSVTAQNVPREYEVFYSVSFSLAVGGNKLIEPQALAATRVYAWNETEVLGKSAEEEILRQALAQDLARRVVRRIEARGPGAAAAPASSGASAGPASSGVSAGPASSDAAAGPASSDAAAGPTPGSSAPAS